MTSYLTKKELYSLVHKHKTRLGLKNSDYGFNMIHLCRQSGILLEKLPFKTKYLRGMAVVGNESEEDIILLNCNRDIIEQNFDCSHEYMHLCIHRDKDKKIFNCMDALYVKQDEYIEWQANEGAAELLVPYEEFLPLIKYFSPRDSYDIKYMKEHAAEMFGVTIKVIEFRLESLKYEIHQYLRGTPINEIRILSRAQQSRLNINVKSLNDIEKECLDRISYSIPETKFINFDRIF